MVARFQVWWVLEMEENTHHHRKRARLLAFGGWTRRRRETTNHRKRAAVLVVGGWTQGQPTTHKNEHVSSFSGELVGAVAENKPPPWFRGQVFLHLKSSLEFKKKK